MPNSLFLVAILSLAISLAPIKAHSQQQNNSLLIEEELLPPPIGLETDTREKMRKFIQSITIFARSYNPNFSIITHGALELLIKRDIVDENEYYPAKTYMRTIDGVMTNGMFFGDKIFGEPIPDNIQDKKHKLLGIAKSNGLPVFVIDFGTERKTINDSYQLNRKKGYISTIVPAPLVELGNLPSYPPRPFGEHSKSVISLKDVSTFAYISNSSQYGQQAEFAMKMHNNNYDLMITEVLHGRKPLTQRAVETLKYKKVGGKRLVFANVNIGIAENHQFYWKSSWREGSPSWIKDPKRSNKDSYFVEFWDPEWHQIFYGGTGSYIYGLIKLGFDGVLLEGMEDAYRFFEYGEKEQETTKTPTTTKASISNPSPPYPAQ
jgi:cysteinyl-tRNA synthetase